MSLSTTALALAAIGLWSFLAYVGTRLADVPPFFLVGIGLTIGGLVGAFRLRSWRAPLRIYLVGVGGIFGYHFLYFTAFHFAPAVEVNLINYLWPLLIVVLTPVYLPGSALRAHHVVGVLIGMTGAGLVVTGGRLTLDMAHAPGYLLMAGAAVTWASYSLLTKRLAPFPTSTVGGFCLVSGLLALGLHALQVGGQAASPALSAADWLLLIGGGVGPMGLAFYAWDAALKRGDPRIIGALSYLTPLSSTLILVVLGGRSLGWVSGVAMALIITGALIGSADLFRSGQRRRGGGPMAGVQSR